MAKHCLTKFSVEHLSHWQDSTQMQPSLSHSYLLEALQLHHFGNIHNVPLLWHSQHFYPKKTKNLQSLSTTLCLRGLQATRTAKGISLDRLSGCHMSAVRLDREELRQNNVSDMNAFTRDVGQNMQKCGEIEMFSHTFIPLLVSCHYKAHARRCQCLLWCWWCVSVCVVCVCECKTMVQHQHCSRHDYMPWSFLWQEQDLNLSLSPL